MTTNRMQKQMKPKRASALLAVILLVGALSSGYEARATPHKQIGVRGVIQTVDYSNSSFTVLNKKQVTETFIWNSRTWFRQKTPKPNASWIARLFSFSQKASAESLRPGRTALIYYRREYGHSVAREIVVLLPVSAPSMPARQKQT